VSLIDRVLTSDLEPLLPMLKQLKRRYLSYTYRLLDDQDDYAIHFIRTYFDSLKLEDTINIIENLNAESILKVRSVLDTSNKSVVIIKKGQSGK